MDAHIKTVEQWQTGLRLKHISHSLAFTLYSRRDRTIGLLSALFSALVATALFTSFAESDNQSLIIVAGGVSVLATVLSSAASFLKYGELAAHHNHAVASYGQLRRELELEILQGITEADLEKLQQVNAKWSELEQSAPPIPTKLYEEAKRIVAREPLRVPSHG